MKTKIVITDNESDEIESDDGKRDGDCPEMDSTGSEVLAPSARSSPISCISFTTEDETRACEDCHRPCCSNISSPFQPQAEKETLSSFAQNGRNFMC